MKTRLSPEQQAAILRHETPDSVDLSTALVEVGRAKMYDLEPDVARWLQHPDNWVRTAAIGTLVGRWGRSLYVPVALRMLFDEDDDSSLSTVAFALHTYLLDNPDALSEILPSLLRVADGTPFGSLLGLVLETIRRLVPAALPGERTNGNWTLDEGRALYARIRWDALAAYRPTAAMPRPKHHPPPTLPSAAAETPASPSRWKDPDDRPTAGAIRELVHGLAAEARAATARESAVGRAGIKALEWAGLDGLTDLQPQVIECLRHLDGEVRGQAIFTLVGRWGLDTHLEHAKTMMVDDPEPSGQAQAAQALNLYLAEHPAALDETFPALLHALEQTSSGGVMTSALEVILRMVPEALPGERLSVRRARGELEALRSRVRWEALRRYRWN
jgi:hypothetical protein